eukprot:SAG31_NODE_19846_length_590_cov_0.940937_2_plen_108_part_01
MFCDYESGADCQYDGPGKYTCTCIDGYVRDEDRSSVSCKFYINPLPVITGAVFTTFALFVCICYCMYVRSQRAYRKLMNMEGLRLGTSPNEPWVLRKIKSFFGSSYGK